MDGQAAIKEINLFQISAKSVLVSRTAVADEIAMSGVRLSFENLTGIDEPMHCLFDDLYRNMTREVKTRWNDLPWYKSYV